MFIVEYTGVLIRKIFIKIDYNINMFTGCGKICVIPLIDYVPKVGNFENLKNSTDLRKI